MKKIFLVSFFFCCLNSYSIDTLNIRTTQIEQIKLNRIESKIDSLTTVFYLMQNERNYFQTALNSQTVIFSIILSIVIFLFSLISFIQFKLEIKKSKKRLEMTINKLNEDFSSVKTTITKQEELINLALGNLYAAIPKIISVNSQKLFYYISASFYHGKNNYDGPSLRCLELADECLSQILSEQPLKTNLDNDDISSAKNELKALLSNNNEKIVAKAAVLLSKLLNK